LEETVQGGRTMNLLAYIQDLVEQVTGYKGVQQIPVDKPLMDLGVDSLMAVEVRNRLAESINDSLPVSLIFDYPTIDKITRYILKDILAMEISIPENNNLPDDPLGDILHEDIKKLLAEELDNSKTEDTE